MDPSFVQEINFQGSESEFSAGVISQDVRIKCSAGDHNHGSSKIKLTDMVDFNFGLRLCPGHLIAIHRTGQYIAYGLKTKDHGMVRVINTNSKEKTLIKGVRGLIYDIAFAFCTAEVLISFVDEDGVLFVYEIVNDETKKELIHKMVVQLSAPQVRGAIPVNRSNSSRVTWCPYVPSFGEDEASCAEHSKLLVLLRLGGSAEVLDVGELARSERRHLNSDDNISKVDGYVRLDECHTSIVDASFSPDGTALATAGLDGYVKFFQVFLRDDERPRCLHEWRPHDGKALSSLLFLDNINAYGTDCKFWKFAVTGALNNSELKVWSCETWTCTQTLVFLPNPCAISPDLYLKVRLDATGTYLLLTETNNRLLYVLQIHRDDINQQAAVDSVAEFLLPAACISFCVRYASAGVTGENNFTGSRKKQLIERFLQDDLDDGDLNMDDEIDNDSNKYVNIHMYLMQTKCLQECRLVFRPEMADSLTVQPIAPSTIITTTDESLADAVPVDVVRVNELKLDDLQTSVQQLIIKLDDHNGNCDSGDDSTIAADANSAVCETVDDASVVLDDSVVNVSNAGKVDVVVVDNLIDIDVMQAAISGESLSESIDLTIQSNHTDRVVVDRNFASGGSSPSREVQEILLSLQCVQSELSQQQQHVVPTNTCAVAVASATYTPKQFFDSLTKVQQHSQQQHKGDSKSASGGQDWPVVPKLSNIELEQQQHHKRLEARIAALESFIRRHIVQLATAATTTADQQQRQQQQQLKGVCDDVLAALNAHAQHITSELEQHRRSLDAVVQGAIAAIASAKPVVVKQPLPLQTPAIQINSNTLALAVQQELKSIVLPLVQATFDQLHRSLETQHTQRLAHLDSLLRSNVQRLFSQCAGQNKSVVAEALSGALVQMVRPGLESQYRDLMATSLVPAWEKVCEAMFQQIHATFTQGTKEYCSAMERYCAEQQQVQQQVQQQLQAQVSCAFSRLEVALSDVVREEVRASTATHSDASGNSDGTNVCDKNKTVSAPTAMHINKLQYKQELVTRLLQPGTTDRNAICEAFQIALSASDTALVLYVCERVHEIFGSAISCNLPQHVLLSLIQQLAVSDLTLQTELKHCYLEEALLALDINSAVARVHGPKVLKDLLQELTNFFTIHPTHKRARSMRMLHIVAQSYVLNRDRSD